MGLNTYTCGFTTPTGPFNRDQLLMACTQEISVKTDHLCLLDLSSWEVKGTVECGPVIVKRTGKMLKCQ